MLPLLLSFILLCWRHVRWSRLELAFSYVEPAGVCLEPCGAGWSLPVAMWSRLELACSHVELAGACL